MEIIELLFLGFLAGMMSAFFGVGGGVIIVPLLNLFYPEIPQKFVIATSLSIIFFNTLFNSFNFRKRVKVEFKIILPVAITSLVFAWIASFFTSNLDSYTLKLIFIICIVLIVIKILFDKKLENIKADKEVTKQGYKTYLLGLITGSISGLTGLGGGVINVPLLHIWLGISFKKLAAYSSMIMIFTTFSSTLFNALQSDVQLSLFYNYGLIVPKITIIVIFASFIGSRIGVHLHSRMDSKELKQYFVALLILTIIRSLSNLNGS